MHQVKMEPWVHLAILSKMGIFSTLHFQSVYNITILLEDRYSPGYNRFGRHLQGDSMDYEIPVWINRTLLP